MGLGNAAVWLGRAVDALHSNGAALVEGLRAVDYVHEMLLLLLMAAPRELSALPEPLMLDHGRVRALGANLRAAVTLAACHTLSIGAAPALRPHPQHMALLRERVGPLLAGDAVDGPALAACVVDVAAQCAALKDGAVLAGSVCALVEGRHPVAAILARRATACLRPRVPPMMQCRLCCVALWSAARARLASGRRRVWRPCRTSWSS